MKKQIIASLSCAVLQVFSIASTADAATIITNNVVQPYCREYTQTFTIGNTTQKGYGTACLQPDGSWEIQRPASTAQAPGQVIVEQQPITYVVRDDHTYVVPVRPYTENVVVLDGPRYRHRRW